MFGEIVLCLGHHLGEQRKDLSLPKDVMGPCLLHGPLISRLAIVKLIRLDGQFLLS